MSKRNVLLLVVLSGLLFAFSIGVLVARPVNAQTKVSATWLGFLPHQSDLWQLELGNGNDWDGTGFHFAVQADAQGRLPVVTQVVDPPVWGGGGINTILFKWEDENGGYTEFFKLTPDWGDSILPTFSPGLMLKPGDYQIRGNVGGENKKAGRITLIGYWAQP